MMDAPPEEAPVLDNKPADEPPDQPMGTDNVGNGPPDGFGLGKGSGRGGPGGGNGFGRAGANALGVFGGKVSSTLRESLKNNPKTRNAKFNLDKVRVYADATGRIERAEAPPTGDANVDAAIRDLAGTQLPPPPAGTRMPIVIRIKASRPN